MSRVIYHCGETPCHGYVAHPAQDDPAPVVMVAPAFGGVGPFSRAKADWLAGLGYIGFEIDYYGHGAAAGNEDEARSMMHRLQADRPLLLARMQAALEAAAGLDGADPTRIAAIGFCFGGKAVLDLARSGATLAGVVPIHGVYDPPPGGSTAMKSPVLVLHGWDDPLATPQDTVALADELTAHCPDWQMLAFGHTGHAFTNPGATRPEAGMAFAHASDRRAFAALAAFLTERFAPQEA